jgi:CDP-diglyceride synthetase
MNPWKWSWYGAGGAAAGALMGALIAQALTEGWRRTVIVGLFAGIGAVLGQVVEQRSGAGKI